MAELQRDHHDEDRTATSTGPHATHHDDDETVMHHDETRHDESARGARAGRVFEDEERHELRERWDALQGRFVDDPSGSTRLADELLRDTRDRVTRKWEERHRELTDRWQAHDEPSTEDLRTTLRRYRDAFEQLLSA